jgi:hypothetical protein
MFPGCRSLCSITYALTRGSDWEAGVNWCASPVEGQTGAATVGTHLHKCMYPRSIVMQLLGSSCCGKAVLMTSCDSSQSGCSSLIWVVSSLGSQPSKRDRSQSGCSSLIWVAAITSFPSRCACTSFWAATSECNLRKGVVDIVTRSMFGRSGMEGHLFLGPFWALCRFRGACDCIILWPV